MTASPSSAGPNVLLLQADQFRWDCLGIAGNPDIHTPNLDLLAADSVRYTEAFCPLPVCTPSRYSLLTGLYVHQHGASDNHSTLPPHIDTFPRALRRAGYRTSAVGKMPFTPTYLDLGYTSMVLAEQHGPGRYDDDYHRDLRAAGLAPVVDLLDQEAHLRGRAPNSYWETFGAGRSDLPEQWHSTTWIGDRALHELDFWSGSSGGQLLHVSFVKPHHPFDPPAPWDGLYEPAALTPLPGWTEQIPEGDVRHRRAYFDYGSLTEPVLRRVMAHYYASITHLDHQVGRIIRRLRELGQYENTLVVFTADHGEYLGFHHLLLKGGPMYEPLVRVPLLVKFPATARRGEVNDSLTSLIDLAPTILAACGQEPSGHALPGRNLADPAGSRTHIFAEDRRRGRALMARSRTHKLLLADDPAENALYDLRADPYELTNWIADPSCAPIAGDLHSALWRWIAFDTPAPAFLDESASQISAPNVPAGDPARRAEHRDHFTAAVHRQYPGQP